MAADDASRRVRLLDQGGQPRHKRRGRERMSSAFVIALAAVTAVAAFPPLAAHSASHPGAASKSPPVPAAAPATAVSGGFEALECDELTLGGLPGLEVGDVSLHDERARCGLMTVPLSYKRPQAEQIQLAVAVLKARVPSPRRDPIVVVNAVGVRTLVPFFSLAGDNDNGSGQTSPLAALREQRDVVVFDPRGTGFSRPALDCPAVYDVEVPGEPEAQAARVAAATARCGDRLAAQGHQLDAYGTVAAARDLGVVREALGYRAWNVYAVGAGTRVALHAAQLEPRAVRTLTFDSPIPPQVDVLTASAGGYRDALLNAAGGDALQKLNTVVRRLQKNPVDLQVRDEFAARTIPVRVTPFMVTGVVHQLLAEGFAPYISLLADELAGGNYELLLQVQQGLVYRVPPSGPPDRQPLSPLTPTTIGAWLSAVCAEDASATSRSALHAEVDGFPVLEAFVEQQPFMGLGVFEICEQWDVSPAGPDVARPMTGDIPRLVAVGQLDPTVPREAGAGLAAGPGGYLVEAPSLGFAPLFTLGECGTSILERFLAEPGERPSTDCADDRVPEPPESFPPLPTVASRIGGRNRYVTAAHAALRSFPTSTSEGGDVIIASGADFPDALSASGLAGALQAPVLLTEPNALPTATKIALADLDPSTVHIAGGPAAVGSRVEDELADEYDVRRHAGADRYATAARLAEALAQTRNGAGVGELAGLRTAFVATGQRFPDALAAGPLAHAGRHPTLLVTRTEVPAATLQALDNLAVEQVVILGGPAAVSMPVEERLEQAVGRPALRLAGDNRYATAAKVADFARARFGFTGPAVVLARGDGFADALAGGPHGGAAGAPLLLVQPAVPPATTRWLQEHVGALHIARALGDPAAVSQRTLREAAELITTAQKPPLGGPGAGGRSFWCRIAPWLSGC